MAIKYITEWGMSIVSPDEEPQDSVHNSDKKQQHRKKNNARCYQHSQEIILFQGQFLFFLMSFFNCIDVKDSINFLAEEHWLSLLSLGERVVASYKVVALQLSPCRDYLRTYFGAIPTARMELAPLWRIDRTWDISFEQYSISTLGNIGCRDRSKQCFRIGM